MEAVIYARLSKDKTGAGLAIERQRDELVDHFSLPPGIKVYADNDISATSGKLRPEYVQLVKDMRQGQIKKVYVWHTDRLWRVPRDLEDFIDAQDTHNVTCLALQAGIADLSTPGGRVAARIGVSIAKYEVEIKAERQKAANLQAAQSGKPPASSPRCFGFERDGTTHIPGEAKVLRELARDCLNGATLKAMCRGLDAAGITTVLGNTWSVTGLKTLLTNPRLAGIRKYYGQTFPGTWEPIIEPDKWEAVRAILTSPQRSTNRGDRQVKHLLSGIATCALCGARMVSNTSRPTSRRGALASYTCSKYRHVSINREVTDDYVTGKLLARFLAAYAKEPHPVPDEIIARLLPREDESIQQIARDTVTALVLRIDEIDTAMSDPNATAIAALLTARQGLERQLAEARKVIREHEASPALRELVAADDIVGAWYAHDVHFRRQIIMDLGTKIALRAPHRGHHVGPLDIAEYVVIEWR